MRQATQQSTWRIAPRLDPCAIRVAAEGSALVVAGSGELDVAEWARLSEALAAVDR